MDQKGDFQQGMYGDLILKIEIVESEGFQKIFEKKQLKAIRTSEIEY